MNTNISITIYDILSYLFPGIMLIFVSYEVIGFEVAYPESVQLILLLVVGYILGAFLHIFGFLLFKGFYKQDYKDIPLAYFTVKKLDAFIDWFPLIKAKSTKHLIKPRLDKAILDELGIDLTKERLGRFTLADSIASTVPVSDREILLSKEGLFRSLTSLVFVTLLIMVLTGYVFENLWAFTLLLFALELLRSSREFYRTLKNQRIYALALLKLSKKI